MARIRDLFGGLTRSMRAPHVNREGYPAWTRPLDEQYLQTLLTNTLGQTFYASQAQLLAEAEAVHDAMVALDPAFAAAALRFARTEGFMRSQPVFGLAKLAGVDGPHFERAFDGVIRTPKDLADFATIVKSLRGSHGGRRIKRVAGKWLLANLTEYWAIKYGRQAGFALRDLLRIYHPKAGDRLPLIDHLLGKDVPPGKLPQLEAFERLKVAETAAAKVEAIAAGRLPHEVVTPFAGKSTAVWEALVPQLPAFALLRHLAALERHGVLDANRAVVESKLTDPKVIGRSKILPFRFAKAIDHVNTAWAKDVLREALELAFVNVPDLPGRVAVLLDRSGSMHGFMKTAAIFGVCVMKKARLDGRLLLFDHDLEEVKVSMRDSILTQAERIRARGGTDVALPMKRLLHDRDKVDTVVLITDEQQNRGTPFLDVLDAYRRKVNPDVSAVIVDVAPYRSALTPGDPKTWYVYGWSDQALAFVGMAARGFGSMADHLRASVSPAEA